MTPPPPDTAERWAWDYIASDCLEYKLAPPPVPSAWEASAPARRVAAPGRPKELRVAARAPKSPKSAALGDARQRARLVHAFFHHELQAAELMAWALLAFPDAPPPLRAGLARVAEDEVRHMGMYAAHLAALGGAIGDHPVHDWFWERVPRAASIVEFLATMGIGFEGGNLDHASRFEALFRAAGDEAGAEVLATVKREEIAHVKLAVHWFERLTGRVEFDAWRARITPPLTPTVMRGAQINPHDRARAGLGADFLQRLGQWNDASRGS